MARVHIYRTYRWVDKDPIIDAVRTVVQGERLKNSAVHQISGVATATLDNWFGGATKKPQNSTVCAVTTSLGYVRSDDIRPDGTLQIGFKKKRNYGDYAEEMEKQKQFFLKTHGPPKKKPPRKKRKSNGHG